MELPKTGDLLLGKYLLEKPLGQGGMGIVYAASHQLLNQRVAVKFLRPEALQGGDSVARFLNEARSAARIENEHVARVLDVGMLDDQLPYMVLEYLDGADLASVLHERGPLPVADTVDFLLQTIEAVAHAHALGIVHRDLKPSNLFLARRQDGMARLKVLDFGISKALTPIGGSGSGSGNITKTNVILGSPLYMSPEQLRDSKSVDHRCDIWALGVVAYELLTGNPPFNADNAVALFAAIQESDPASIVAQRPDIPVGLEVAIRGCLQRRADDRYASVTELASSLVPFGTVIASRAFENARRILPLSNTFQQTVATKSKPPTSDPRPNETAQWLGAQAASSSNPTHPLSQSSQPNPLSRSSQPNQPLVDSSTKAMSSSGQLAGQPQPVITGDWWSSSQTSARAKSRGKIALIISLAVGFWGLVIIAFVMGSRYWHSTTATSSTMPSSSVAASGKTEVATPTGSEAATTPPTTSVPVASASSATEPVAVAKTVASTITPAAPIAPVVATSTSTAVAIKPTATPAAAASASAKKTTPTNCATPFEFDSAGKKVWKRECL